MSCTEGFILETAEPSLTVPISSGNARAIYDHLVNFYTVPSLSPIFQKLASLQARDVSGALLEEALNDLQPSCNATASFAASDAQFVICNALSSRLASWRFWHAIEQQSHPKNIAALSEELLASNSGQLFKKNSLHSSSCVLNMGRRGDRHSVWFNPFGNITHLNNYAGAEVPFHTYTGGALLGMDNCIFDSGLFGGSVGAARSSIILSQGQGHQTVNYYFASLNGSYTIENFFIEAGFLTAYDQLQNSRYINLPDLDRTASSSHNMWQVTPQISAGYLFWIRSWGVEPFISESWVFNFEQKTVEHGAALLDTETAARNSSLLRSEIGLNLYKDHTFSNGGILLFRAMGAYVHQLPSHMGFMNVSFFNITSSSFQVNSFTKTQTLGAASAEVTYGAINGILGSVQYEGEFGEGYSSNNLQLQLGYSF